ncbi:hypothetical protein SAMN05216474_1146 [Lishizhenia tianjinensis]|uniref:TonB protein C-terminal n=1 Tax=Lishizhenia tianjinensis TaxID=477690 RepID=A0A1I6YSQ7_9FLAO|nr:hypothetical protein [Lishizhenia tianjinensis]SFT53512.1 hypothetical protein SAMN05216474_1146 [Lishizhenia tianjinensis]
MKILITVAFAALSLFTSAQVSGDLKNDNRNLLTATDFKLKGKTQGVMYFNIAVDSEGKVSSVVLDRTKSTIKSTPSMIQAKNTILGYQFQKGTHYPKYHQGVVKITFVKEN